MCYLKARSVFEQSVVMGSSCGRGCGGRRGLEGLPPFATVVIGWFEIFEVPVCLI